MISKEEREAVRKRHHEAVMELFEIPAYIPKTSIIDSLRDIPALINLLDAETKRADEAMFSQRTVSYEAGRDRWKARAEALERAIFDVSEINGLLELATCHACVFGNTKHDGEPCNGCLEAERFPSWQFDEARFGKEQSDE